MDTLKCVYCAKQVSSWLISWTASENGSLQSVCICHTCAARVHMLFADAQAPGSDRPAVSGKLAQGRFTHSYSHSRYAQLIADTVEKINSLSQLKGGEYAGDDDRLANFRRNGQALGVSMEAVWAVYAGKHWDAIQQYVKDIISGKERPRAEPISGRADDLIVYLILFKAMYEEREGHA